MPKRLFARLSARKPNPSQHALDALFKKVTRARVLDGGTARGKALGKEVLLDISDAQAIAILQDCLAIVEDESTFGHCMCLGDQALELYAGRRLVATIGLHHGRSIRWEAWKHDALLQDGHRLLTWLAERGVTAPLEAYEEDQRRAEAYRQAAAKWQGAMPKCLLPFWDQMQASAGGMVAFIPTPQGGQPREGQIQAATGDLAPLLRALEAEYPDVEQRVLALFRWYGSGQGPWSGFPSYESVAEGLLLTFPTGQLVAALSRHSLTPPHLEGAARYFAGYCFNTYRRREAQQLPKGLKQRLLAHSLLSSDEDKLGRAKRAFSG